MATQLLEFKPGLNVELTPVLNMTGWASSNRIRFRNQLPEKIGGWEHINPAPLIGTARGLHAWADLNAITYVAVGTEQRLTLLSNDMLTDITPIRYTSNNTPDFTTALGSPIVSIQDVGSPASVKDWIDIVTPVSVGGLVLQGLYQVISTPTPNTYTIDAGIIATATQTGGSVPVYSVTIDQEVIDVIFPSAGLVVGGYFTTHTRTLVGGIELYGDNVITSIIDTDHFTIQPGPSATATATVAENAGAVQLQYLVETGFASATPGSGYGAGSYGSGLYGDATPSDVFVPVRQFFLDNFGQDLIGNYTAGPLFVWVPPIAQNNVATLLTGDNVPAACNASFVAMPQEQLFALGMVPLPDLTNGQIFDVIDPRLVGWSDVGDYTTFRATSTNQAGTFEIPTGSRVVGGIQGPQFVCIWTDIDFYLAQYLGFPLVWGFNKIDSGAGLLSARAAGVYENLAFWASGPGTVPLTTSPLPKGGNFYMYNGSSAGILPCPVWDYFWRNLNWKQADKVVCCVNSMFNEVFWCFPYGTNNEVSAYVKYNFVEPAWDFGLLVRTCWSDVSAFGSPMGVDGNGNIQQHEIAADDDGNPMGEYVLSGYAAISLGDDFMSIKRFLPDFYFEGDEPSVGITILAIDYSPDQAAPITKGPYTVTAETPYTTTKGARGRGVAVKIGNSSLGSFWRLGGFRYVAQPSGRR